MRIHAIVAVLVILSSCAAPPPPADAAIDPEKLIDLSYAYSNDTVFWPNAEGFRHRKDVWATTEGGYWYAAGEFTSAEHGGTHLDSPIHFAEGKATVDQIPVSRLVGPALVIDISTQAVAERDYRATPQDVLNWEQTNGSIPARSIVVFRTGWGQYWPDRKQYMGDDTPGATTNLHFPGISREAAELLVQRGVAGVGIDTASLDYGPSTDFIVHRVLNGAGIYGLENIANAERLPQKGATLIALPMKIAEGSGAPARIIALLP